MNASKTTASGGDLYLRQRVRVRMEDGGTARGVIREMTVGTRGEWVGVRLDCGAWRWCGRGEVTPQSASL